MGHFITLLVLSLILLPGVSSSLSAESIIVDHSAVTEFDSISSIYIEAAMTADLFYGHTSHGGQIVTGMEMLRDENPLYAFNMGSEMLQLSEYNDDLGHNGDTSWAPITRNHLDTHPETNIVMWSWCGGCSDNTEEGIDTYLDMMSILETEYPDVTFIYMTGHLDGSGPVGELYRSNNQIREYCYANNKILFDFADIESYDPVGLYYPYESDGCGWCAVWCSQNPCPDCGSCAHSHCFNCYLKGKGFWWMMARIHGWQSPSSDGGDPPHEENPASGILLRNWPNPATHEINFSLTLPEGSPVSLELFSISGRKVATILNQTLPAGERVIKWDGLGAAGRALSRGSYYCRLQAKEVIVISKITIVSQ